MKEKFKNLFLSISSWYRYVQWYPKNGNQDIVPRGYEKESIEFNHAHNYYPYNVEKIDKYWIPQFVHEVEKSKHYILSTAFLPKKFDNISIPWGTGVIESKEEFKYGYFTCKLLLPLGLKYIWPAFWLYGSDGKIYTEIDIMEAYSKEGEYGAFSKFQSNVHYQYNESPWINTGAKNHPISEHRFFDDCFNCVGTPFERSFIKFSLHWTEDFLRFYYDGYLVREITNKELLGRLVPMKLVINNSVESDKNPSLNSTLEVKDIEVWRKIQS